MVYHPEYKGIRLDVYAKDQNNKRYNVEMQVKKDVALVKRSRYYHSQMDMELLAAGTSYEELPDTFVIFLCDYDPFGRGLYCYTCGTQCKEDASAECDDGCQTIYLSTKGKNAEKLPKSLVRFLKFVAADMEQSESDFEDEFVGQLQKSIHNVKESREMGERYMIFEEMMRDERKAGREEGVLLAKRASIFDLLEEMGTVSEELEVKIHELSDEEQLKVLHKLASKAESIEDFEEKAKKVLA